MPRWVPVIEADAVRAGFGKFVKVEGYELAVFNDAGEYYTVDDSCPHQGASLGEGFLHEGRVICPWHSWAFDIRTGACPRVPNLSVASYPTRRAGEMVEVRLPDPGAAGDGGNDTGGGTDPAGSHA